MKTNGKKLLLSGIAFSAAFAVWTLLVMTVDVQPVGPNSTSVGFASFNMWFHKLTGLHMAIYNVTDWLGLVPVSVCVLFGATGLFQLIRRKSLFKVDSDILLLGVYYIAVISGYLIFETFPVNYRPVLIDGFLEASYPSSTVLLVLGVMPTLAFQANRKLSGPFVKRVISILIIVFSVFMVIGRIVSGVHWFSDIIGSVLLSTGLFLIYKAVVLLCCRK